VSVYDCWFLRHPDAAVPAVIRAGQVLRRAVADGAVVHASSHATAEAVRELLPGAEVAVITLGALAVPEPGGVRLSGTALGPLVGAPYVLATGTIERRKNLPVLVRAFARLAADHRDVRLVIAGGDGDDRSALDATIALLPEAMQRQVVLTGRVDEATMGWLLRNATVLAYPSLDEGFGFPLLDAMQVGVPVVASDAGSIPEVAGDAALLGPPGDIDGLADRLQVALTDSAERARLVSAGAARVRQHAWTATASGLLDLYRRLSERR
jgi:glycosyltransferase involved in cell wall biosynthesis